MNSPSFKTENPRALRTMSGCIDVVICMFITSMLGSTLDNVLLQLSSYLSSNVNIYIQEAFEVMIYDTLFYIIFFIVALILYIVIPSKREGKTIGKSLTEIKLIDNATNQAPSKFTLFRRSIVIHLSILAVIINIGGIIVLYNKTTDFSTVTYVIIESLGLVVILSAFLFSVTGSPNQSLLDSFTNTSIVCQGEFRSLADDINNFNTVKFNVVVDNQIVKNLKKLPNLAEGILELQQKHGKVRNISGMAFGLAEHSTTMYQGNVISSVNSDKELLIFRIRYTNLNPKQFKVTYEDDTLSITGVESYDLIDNYN